MMGQSVCYYWEREADSGKTEVVMDSSLKLSSMSISSMECMRSKH